MFGGCLGWVFDLPFIVVVARQHEDFSFRIEVPRHGHHRTRLKGAEPDDGGAGELAAEWLASSVRGRSTSGRHMAGWPCADVVPVSQGNSVNSVGVRADLIALTGPARTTCVTQTSELCAAARSRRAGSRRGC